jgi:hypothetical protein
MIGFEGGDDLLEEGRAHGEPAHSIDVVVRADPIGGGVLLPL